MITLLHADLRGDASARSHTGGWEGALEKLERTYAA